MKIGEKFSGRRFNKVFFNKTLRRFVLYPFLFFIAMIATLMLSVSHESTFVNEEMKFQNRLSIPERLQHRIENGWKVFDLDVQQGEMEFFPGQPTKTYGFNGNYLGPTIRAQKGDRIRINVTNKLDDTTTVHWHGMHLPAKMDGNSHQVIRPKKTWHPYWLIINEAATLWYHPHTMLKTGEQVYQGLAGFFLIDDEHSDQLDIPKEYGTDDIPLVIQDREFDQNNQFVYEPERSDAFGHTGMLGDKILVNGTYAPYVELPAKKIRLRILNGSNARRYNIGFENYQTFYQLATDGGFLEEPVARTRMILSPGERAEVIVDLSKHSEPLTLISDSIREQNIIFRFAKKLFRSERDENQLFKILEIRPKPTSVKSDLLPRPLNTIHRIEPDSSVKTRKFVLDPRSRTINGKSMDHKRVDETIRTGEVEIWEIKNISGVYHPFHIHAVQFLVLERNGNPPADYESGWKDTVLLRNGETVRVIMRFPDYSDPNVPYMFHCHILEHEDMGMMGQFVIVNRDTKSEDIYIQTDLTEGLMETHSH